tara:strand:+ start:6714 stop:7298 length:585 start_codon:yes stop_codon:yes gene_type:complete
MSHYEEQYAEFGPNWLNAEFSALCVELNKAVANKDPKKFAEIEKKLAELPLSGHVDVTDTEDGQEVTVTLDGQADSYEERIKPDWDATDSMVPPFASGHVTEDESTYDRFDLEDKIQNVWITSEDVDTILFRVSDDPDGPPSEDQLANLLIGLKEMHDSRCRKLMHVFETMIHDNCFGDKYNAKGVHCPLKEKL